MKRFCYYVEIEWLDEVTHAERDRNIKSACWMLGTLDIHALYISIYSIYMKLVSFHTAFETAFKTVLDWQVCQGSQYSLVCFVKSNQQIPFLWDIPSLTGESTDCMLFHTFIVETVCSVLEIFATLCVLWLQYSSGDYDLALMGYLKAGELGYELAQVNAAWMISKGYGTPYTTDQPLPGNYIAQNNLF